MAQLLKGNTAKSGLMLASMGLATAAFVVTQLLARDLPTQQSNMGISVVSLAMGAVMASYGAMSVPNRQLKQLLGIAAALSAIAAVVMLGMLVKDLRGAQYNMGMTAGALVAGAVVAGYLGGMA